MASLSFTLHPPPFNPLFPLTPSSSSSSLLHRSTLPFPNPSQTLPSPKPTISPRHRCLLPLAINLSTASSPGDPLRGTLPNQSLRHARNMFDSLPHPVKKFPWAKVLESFLGLVVDLAAAVVKWLSVPVLTVSSLSEMSYCAHERKMRVIPIPFVLGFALAGMMKDVAAEVSKEFEVVCFSVIVWLLANSVAATLVAAEGAFPWHLLLIATFFVLLKLPGPYYPYWGRLVIPHFANGGLWRSVWLAFMWYRRAQSSFLLDNGHDQQ